MLLNLEAIKYNIFKALFNHLPDKASRGRVLRQFVNNTSLASLTLILFSVNWNETCIYKLVVTNNFYFIVCKFVKIISFLKHDFHWVKQENIKECFFDDFNLLYKHYFSATHNSWCYLISLESFACQLKLKSFFQSIRA